MTTRHMSVRRALVWTGFALYGLILITQALTIFGLRWGGNLIPLASVAGILIEGVIVVVLCVTKDHREGNAGWVSLGVAAGVWLLGIHFWASAYWFASLITGRLYTWSLPLIVLLVGHGLGVLAWASCIALAIRIRRARNQHFLPVGLAIAISAIGIIAAVIGISSAL